MAISKRTFYAFLDGGIDLVPIRASDEDDAAEIAHRSYGASTVNVHRGAQVTHHALDTRRMRRGG